MVKCRPCTVNKRIMTPKEKATELLGISWMYTDDRIPMAHRTMAVKQARQTRFELEDFEVKNILDAKMITERILFWQEVEKEIYNEEV